MTEQAVSEDQLHHLIRMANQIGANAPTLNDEDAVDFVVQHLRKFWARSMKQQIAEYASAGGEDLSPIALAAVRKLSPN